MICVSIPEKNTDKCLAMIESSEMAEIRIDLAGFNETEVRRIFSKSDKPLIATCRPEITEDKLRVKLLKAAIDEGADYVDVEFDATKEVKPELIEYAKTHNCKVIISYHNFTDTPDKTELYAIIDSSFIEGADIVKIATTAQCESDCAKILSIYEHYPSNNLVALAMGETGKITRVANLFLGSPFTFASISEEQKTASGQLTVSEINIIKNIIRKV